MENRAEAYKLSIYVGELDKVNNTPLYELIVYIAKKHNISGATVTRGIMSYGKSSVLHTAKLLTMSEDLPIIIEIIDKKEKINDFIKIIEPYLPNAKYGGLITVQPVEVIVYKGVTKDNYF